MKNSNLGSGDKMNAAVQINGIYEHYKGKRYKVHGLAKHSETLQDMVYYECLYPNDSGQMWVRPLELFTGFLEVQGQLVPRFKLVT